MNLLSVPKPCLRFHSGSEASLCLAPPFASGTKERGAACGICCFRERDTVKKSLFTSILIAAILLPPMAQATPVTVGDRQWQQPDLLAGVSWNQLATVCPTNGGQCNGSLASTDLTGWRWASVGDVASLFATFEGHPGHYGSHSEFGSAWAPQLTSLFTPTLRGFGASIVFGWTRSSDYFGGRYSVYVINHRFPRSLDVTRVSRLPSGNIRSRILGAWMYRDVGGGAGDVAAVKEPPPVALMMLGFVGLVAARRRPAEVRKKPGAAARPSGPARMS